MVDVGEPEHHDREQHHRRDEPRARATRPSPHDGSEPVADAAHGVDAHRAVELLADLREVHVDGARVAEPVVAPHAVEDLLAAQREARAFGEEAEELELLGRERDRLVAHAHFAAAEVDRRAARPG